MFNNKKAIIYVCIFISGLLVDQPQFSCEGKTQNCHITVKNNN